MVIDSRDPATVTDARAISPLRSRPASGHRGGELLAGRYVMHQLIAAGGMGEVYRADDTLLGEPVAVKLLRPELVVDAGARARFGDEIRLARKVTHANVCRVFDVGVEGDQLFFTMELFGGGTLASLLVERGALALEQAAPLLRQALAGVAAAHDAGVIHADLKPSNLLLDGPRLVVTDFGLAMPCCAKLGCACAMPHFLGTPAYTSPEQVAGDDVSTRSDVFSLGVIIFQMLTGQRPFSGATTAELARARLESPAPALRERLPDIEPRWSAVVGRCLARDPADRPADAPALMAELGMS